VKDHDTLPRPMFAAVPGRRTQAGLAGLAAVVLLAGCGEHRSEAEKQFLAGCLASSPTRAQQDVCHCMLAKLQKQYTAEEFEALGRQQPQRLLQATVDSARLCMAGQ